MHDLGGEDQLHHHLLIALVLDAWDGEDDPPIRAKHIDACYPVALDVGASVDQMIAHCCASLPVRWSRAL